MTRRDLVWRAAGLVLLFGGCASGMAIGPAASPTVIIPAFITAIAGIVLLTGGRRVAAAIRIELGPHRALPAAIRARRLARHRARHER